MSLVNLNKARKSRTKDQARKTADANAVKFGRTKAQKSSDAAETAKTTQTLDSAKRNS